MTAWAHKEPSVQALVLIGSQSRPTHDFVWSADSQSDWDFQIITSEPQMFANNAWAKRLEQYDLRVYSAREARLGDVPKITAVFSNLEADFVILPSSRLEQISQATSLGQHNVAGEVRRNLQSLAVVLRPGWVFLKGAKTWEPFYKILVEAVPDPRLDDTLIRNLADGFVCDYVWSLRKLRRGELVSVQRALHRELGETNLRLLHELRLRRGERSFPEGRRLERLATLEELKMVSISSLLQYEALEAELRKSAHTLQELVAFLLCGSWHWPVV